MDEQAIRESFQSTDLDYQRGLSWIIALLDKDLRNGNVDEFLAMCGIPSEYFNQAHRDICFVRDSLKELQRRKKRIKVGIRDSLSIE